MTYQVDPSGPYRYITAGQQLYGDWYQAPKLERAVLDAKTDLQGAHQAADYGTTSYEGEDPEAEDGEDVDG